MTPPALALVVAVPTFRRTGQLAALLPLLAAQLGNLDARPQLGIPSARLLVIDNDPDRSAAAVVSRANSHRVSYVAEAEPGVVAVRNRALLEAGSDELLVFIDDDEQPAPGWLSALVETFRRYPTPGVAGPVRSRLPEGTDSWIVSGGFFDRRHRRGLPTGAEIGEAATNNLLLDLRQVRAHGLAFDAGFALTGGEDSLFTRQLCRSAGPLRWCADAEVTEDVPADRLTRSWVRSRAVSLANSEPRVRLAMAGGPGERALLRARSGLRGAARIAAGAGGWGLGLLTRSTARRARATRTLCRGVGLLAGAGDLAYLEYGRSGRRWTRASLGASR